MKNVKKILIAVMAVVLAVGCVCAFAACNKDQGIKVKVLNVDLSSEQYAFAVKKNDTALLNSVNEFFVAKKTEIDAIFAKYTAEDADLTSFGDASIKTTPTGADNELVVATNLEFAPFEYINGNKIAGIDMEIAQLLANYLNKELVVVHMEFDAVVESVQNLDTYDIGIAGLTITEERKELVNFSNPYFGTTQVLVIKEDDETFKDCTTSEQVEAKLKTLQGDAAKCGGQIATTSQFYINGDEALGFDGYSNLKFNAYSSAALAIQDMLNGKIAFVVVDKTTAGALVKSING